MKTTRIGFTLFFLLTVPITRVATAADQPTTPTIALSAPSAKFTEITDQLPKLFDEQQNYLPHGINLPVDQLIAEMAKPGYKRERTLTDIQNDIKNQIALLVAEDPKSAAVWVQNSRNVPNNMLDMVVRAWAQKEPASAAHFVTSTPGMERLQGSVADAWPKSDYLAELTWVESLPEGRTRPIALSSALMHMAQFDAPGAWARAIHYVGNPDYHGIYTHILMFWSDKDPLAAAQAMASLPDGTYGNLTTNIASILISHWVRRDPVAVLAWAKTLPSGALSDAVKLTLNVEQLANAHGGTMVSTGGTVFTSDGTAINRFTGEIRTDWHASTNRLKNQTYSIPPISVD